MDLKIGRSAKNGAYAQNAGTLLSRQVLLKFPFIITEDWYFDILWLGEFSLE
jgi:hypothetical protein